MSLREGQKTEIRGRFSPVSGKYPTDRPARQRFKRTSRSKK